jgi:hypothetical protein
MKKAGKLAKLEKKQNPTKTQKSFHVTRRISPEQAPEISKKSDSNSNKERGGHSREAASFDWNKTFFLRAFNSSRAVDLRRGEKGKANTKRKGNERKRKANERKRTKNKNRDQKRNRDKIRNRKKKRNKKEWKNS